MRKFKLINYTDVLGNKKDGYEINNQCIEFDDLTILNNATNKDILNYMFNVGFFTTNDLRKIKIIDSGDLIEFFGKNGHPLGCLEMVQ